MRSKLIRLISVVMAVVMTDGALPEAALALRCKHTEKTERVAAVW